MKILLTFIISVILLNFNLYSQDKTIKGRVITEDLETMPEVIIMVNDTVEVGRTDINGFFQINIPKSINTINFWALGLEPAKIKLLTDCNQIEVIMLLESTYDFISLKRVDKKIKKRFKKLPEIHKKAYEKGLFKAKDPCFIYQFIPYYIKKKKKGCKKKKIDE